MPPSVLSYNRHVMAIGSKPSSKPMHLLGTRRCIISCNMIFVASLDSPWYYLVVFELFWSLVDSFETEAKALPHSFVKKKVPDF
jgi:hypothetical protein